MGGRDVAREQLPVVSSGHQRRHVRKLAQAADVKIANAFLTAGRLLRHALNDPRHRSVHGCLLQLIVDGTGFR